MMAYKYCSECGVSIPENQEKCSICADDPTLPDGYLLASKKYSLVELSESKKENHDNKSN